MPQCNFHAHVSMMACKACSDHSVLEQSENNLETKSANSVHEVFKQSEAGGEHSKTLMTSLQLAVPLMILIGSITVPKRNFHVFSRLAGLFRHTAPPGEIICSPELELGRTSSLLFTVLYIVQYSTVQYSTLHSTQYSTVQYSAIQGVLVQTRGRKG